MRITDAWLEQQRIENERLYRAYGIKQKKYHYLEYNEMGELVCYQETPDSPLIYVRGKKKKMDTVTAQQGVRTGGIRRGRKPKLSDADQANLVADYNDGHGMNQGALASKYGISQATVSKIIKRHRS